LGGHLGDLTPQQRIAEGLTTYVVLLFSLSFHEAAHAWAAFRMGDDTALRGGRISLNPLVHIDPIGTVLLPMIMFLSSGSPLFGWAKPTPYNPANFRRDRSVAWGHIIVAGAGPISNMILAVLFTAMLVVGLRVTGGELNETARRLFAVGIYVNVLLMVFNLVPLPPLDGSKVASWGLPRSLGQSYDRVMEPYGPWILLIMVGTGAIGWLIGPPMNAVFTFLYRFAR